MHQVVAVAAVEAVAGEAERIAKLHQVSPELTQVRAVEWLTRNKAVSTKPT